MNPVTTVLLAITVTFTVYTATFTIGATTATHFETTDHVCVIAGPIWRGHAAPEFLFALTRSSNPVGLVRESDRKPDDSTQGGREDTPALDVPEGERSSEFPEELFITSGRPGAEHAEPSKVAFVKWLSKESAFISPKDTYSASGFELLLYSDGVYADGALAHIHARVEAAFADRGQTASRAFAQEVAYAVARRSLVHRRELNPEGLLNLKNGVLDLKTGHFDPHSPTRRFTRQIPFDFDPNARCAKFLEFLEQVLPKERERREVQKLFGYCVGVPGNPYQCAHMFVGQGNNGKSKLLAILRVLLGKENVAAETLQSLTELQFSSAKLFGKLACIFADLPSNPIRYTSMFKALTGEDLVRAELKFGAIFYFLNGAKLVFSANELPEVSDRTRAFWRRWFLIRFEQDFTGREDRTLPDRLYPELPGILNWALAGVPLLGEDHGFLTELGAEDLKSEWRKLSDTLAWFVAEMVEDDANNIVPKEDFYEAYTAFCAVNRGHAKTPETVGKELPRHAPYIRTAKPRLEPNGPQVRCWKGLRLRSEGRKPVSPVSPVSDSPQPASPDEAETGETSETGGLPLAADWETDPGDLFPGRETRADGAREKRKGQPDKSTGRGKAPRRRWPKPGAVGTWEDLDTGEAVTVVYDSTDQKWHQSGDLRTRRDGASGEIITEVLDSNDKRWHRFERGRK